VDRILNRRGPAGPSTLAFHVSRIVTDAGVVLSMGAMSMSFVTTAGADRTSVAADALPVIILLAPVFLFTLIPDHSRAVPAPLGWIGLGLVLTALPLSVVKYLEAADLASTLDGEVGFGARLLVLGVLVTLFGVALGLSRDLLDRGRSAARPAPPRGARTRPAPRAEATPARARRPAAPTDDAGGSARSAGARRQPATRHQTGEAPRRAQQTPAPGRRRVPPPDTSGGG
jgi:hypothetical protein